MAFGENTSALQRNADKVWTALWLAGLVVALMLFALLHLSGGMQHH